MNTGDIIKKLRKDNKLTQEQLGNLIGVQKSAIAKYENGRVENLKRSTIEKLAEVFGVTPSYILGINESRKPKQGIPLYASISCGYGIFVDDEVLEYLSIPDQFLNPHKEYFACTAHGDSMEGKGINDGDILVFEKVPTLNNGEIGSFCIDENEAVCKTYRRLSSGIVLLESANEKYAPIEVDISNECFRILGKYKFKFSIEQE